MKRVLRPGGMAIIFEHNPRNPLTLSAVNNCEFDENAVLLPHAEAIQLFADLGLRNIAKCSILSVPSFGRLTRSIDLRLGRLWFGAQYFVTATA
jgi:hypothetical protein